MSSVKVVPVSYFIFTVISIAPIEAKMGTSGNLTPPQVIFDITGTIRQILTVQIQNQFEIEEFDLEIKVPLWNGHTPNFQTDKKQLQLSTVVSYTKGLHISKIVEEWDDKAKVTLADVLNISMNPDDMYTMTPYYVTYLFSEEMAVSALNHLENSTTPVDLEGSNLFAIFHLTEYLQSYINYLKSTQGLGIMYDESLLKLNEFPSYVKASSWCVLSIAIDHPNFLTSYPLFTEFMNQVRKNHESIIYDINPSCRPYYRMQLTFKPFKDDSETIRLRYFLLFAKFSMQWAVEFGASLILDSFSTSNGESAKAFENLNHELDTTLPSAWEVIMPNAGFHYKLILPLNPNFMQALLANANKLFQSIYLDTRSIYDSYAKLAELQVVYNCFLDKNSSTTLSKAIVTTYQNGMNDWGEYFHYKDKLFPIEQVEDAKSLVGEIVRKEDVLKLEAVVVGNPEGNISTLEATIKARNVSQGCWVHLSEFVEQNGFTNPTNIISARCHIPVNSTSVLVLLDDEFSLMKKNALRLEFPLLGFFDILHWLHTLLDKRISLQELHPNIKVIFHWERMLEWDVDFGLRLRNNIFCTNVQTREDAYYEGIINLARLHGIPVIVKPLLTTEFTELGWFTHLNTRYDLFNMSLECPVFSSRGKFLNFKQRSNDQELRPDPCLDWQELPPEKIQFGELQGPTFSPCLDRSSVQNGQDVFELRLQLILNRFRSIEIKGVDNECLQNMLIPTKIWNALPAENSSVLVELNVRDVINGGVHAYKLVNWLTGIPAKFVGIHFSGWETSSPVTLDTVKMIKSVKSASNIGLGLTVQDCASELLSGLDRIKQFHNYGNLSYLVCAESRMPNQFPYTMEDLSNYLEDQLYIKTMISRAFPNISVYIRLAVSLKNDAANLREKSKLFLKFIYDVTSFANLYDLRYFVFPAFQNDLDAEGQTISGWWRVADSGDPANASVYTETESEYFDRPMWLPASEPETETETKNAFQYIIILAVVFALIILGFVATAVLLWDKLRRRVLSKEFEAEFRNGVKSESAVVLHYLKIKYNAEKFELPLRKIRVGEVLGRGHFGTVHEAIVDGSKAAVKLTKDNGSVDGVQSMLMEVKLLIHLGDHPNVVKLVGAHTKEIGYGVVYIALELCEKGSLESHLRNLKKDEKVDMYELYRFCEEIATGMTYISGKDVVHSDLATRNVLLDVTFTCKIADFGLSRKLNKLGEYVKTTDAELPWRWMAIESLKEKLFTTKSDVWSFGITVWEILSLGDLPYEKEFPSWAPDHVIKELENGCRLEKPALASDEMFGLIMSCCDSSPMYRPDFEILSGVFRRQKENLYSYV